MGRKRNPIGRPVKLTPELQEEICKAISAGNYIEPSAARAGVSKSSLYSWLKRAGVELDRVRRGVIARPARKELKYIEFLDAVKRAEAEAEARDVAIISKAALTQWQAAAWRLERKHFSRWGRRQAIEHNANEGDEKKVQKVKIGDREIEF